MDCKILYSVVWRYIGRNTYYLGWHYVHVYHSSQYLNVFVLLPLTYCHCLPINAINVAMVLSVLC